MSKPPITISATINSPIDKVWEYWNTPEHIKQWAFASDDWEAPSATNDLRVGGRFVTVMAAKDKSAEFEFDGTYTSVEEKSSIEYVMSDGRHVKTSFDKTPDGVIITTTFDPENENPEEMQKEGWQAILNNFKKHVEEN